MPQEFYNLQVEITSNIKTAMTYWIDGKIKNADSIDLSVTCHSEKYLSFVNSFMYEGYNGRLDYIKDYITIDMSTGQQVYLEDLIEINEKFANLLQGNPSIIKEPPIPMLQTPSSLYDYSTAELLEELKECSYTKEYWIQKGHYPLEDSIGSLVAKNSFFLREGMLVIIIECGGEGFITLDVNDIEDFLKAEKW